MIQDLPQRIATGSGEAGVLQVDQIIRPNFQADRETIDRYLIAHESTIIFAADLVSLNCP